MTRKPPTFRSKAEREFAERLTSRGIAWEYESERLQYLSDYSPDFVIRRKDGTVLYIEFKGYLKPSDRSKLVKVKRHNPDKDIRIVFQRPGNRIRKGSPTTYADWAEKNGFPWADRVVPDDWVGPGRKGRRKVC